MDCEAGKHSSVEGSASCVPCSLGYDSPPGAVTCSQSASGYFVLNDVSVQCPPNADCLGGTSMPQPWRGFWVDRRSAEFSGDIN